MVYNALKLYMEINPDLFDESMQQYKQRKIEYVHGCCSWTITDLESGNNNMLSIDTKHGSC